MYVLLYNVIERAIDLDSDYAMQVLTALHPNISVSIIFILFCATDVIILISATQL